MKRILIGLIAIALPITGCSSQDTPLPPPAPELPVIARQADAERALKTTVLQAVQRAIGVPTSDYDPAFVITAKATGCSKPVAAIVCPPKDGRMPSATVTINPEAAWQLVVMMQGSQTAWQLSALNAAADYLAYQDLQRDFPTLLGHMPGNDPMSQTKANVKIDATKMCMKGAVYGGVVDVMDPLLMASWLKYQDEPTYGMWFQPGTQGRC